MSETLYTFLFLGIITTLHFFIINSRLNRLEEKIDKLRGGENDNPNM